MPAQPVRPVFEFREYGIAIHFVLELEDGQRAGQRADADRELKSGPNFESLERDLLSSVNRELRLAPGNTVVADESALRTLRLFGSRSLEPPVGWGEVELRYPAQLRYMAEGKDQPVFPPRDEDFVGEWRPDELTGNERRRAFRFLPSLTEFRSGAAILHLVFAPIANEPASVINEWDLVVLAKLWQGGEGVGPTDGEMNLSQYVKFVPRGPGDPQCTINQLAQATLYSEHAPNATRSYWERKVSDRLFFEPKAGTLELTCDDGEHPMSVYRCLEQLKLNGVGDPNDLPHIVPVEGILCGLLDYFDIGADELEDVFADPIMADHNTFLDIHKGTLLMLARDIRRIEPVRGRPLGVNPYLLLPQAVLLHNEYWLRRANLRANDVSSRNRIRDVQKTELEIRAALQQHRLPNIFHYRTERAWYDDGHQTRGLNDLQRVVEQQLQHVNGVLDELRAENERTNAFLFGLVGLAIAVFGIPGGWRELNDLLATGSPLHLGFLGGAGVLVLCALLYLIWKKWFK